MPSAGRRGRSIRQNRHGRIQIGLLAIQIDEGARPVSYDAIDVRRLGGLREQQVGEAVLKRDQRVERDADKCLYAGIIAAGMDDGQDHGQRANTAAGARGSKRSHKVALAGFFAGTRLQTPIVYVLLTIGD